MPSPKKPSAKKRPSYETGELRDPKIAEMQVEEKPRPRFFELLRKAVIRKAQS